MAMESKGVDPDRPADEGLLEHAKEALSAELVSRKDRAAGEIADRAAGQVERFADYLKRLDVRDLLDDAGRFAQREPLIFLGGAFAVGLIASRFLKASRPIRRYESYRRGYGDEYVEQ